MEPLESMHITTSFLHSEDVMGLRTAMRVFDENGDLEEEFDD